MAKPAWKPWHQAVELRGDIKSGELTLATFAADIYDVVMGNARSVYQKPEEFFALTYPTVNLRELAKDVVVRLAGKNDKAVRQLELTYGGGKTHALITLYHLVVDPAKLPDMPAVQEFIEHIGTKPPKTRAAVLPFDKLDVEKGMETRSPKGETRWLKNPWSVLAFQIAGADGLKLLHADGKDAERDTPPAENLLKELLELPGKQDMSTLILIDEVLMYVRQKVNVDPAWRGKMVDFFQYLTQAATKVDRCAIVASLLATDPRMSDTFGKELTAELYNIFRRQKEKSVEPVQKDDVAELLRRRFFTPASIKDRRAFGPHVVSALNGITDLDEQTKKDRKAAEDRFLNSYPFHPDLTDVFYSKWTNLEGFQRTRGVLRTFALALRDAEKWDDSPLIGVNVFLGAPGKKSVSEAARELTTIAATEEYEGRKQEWNGILEGELEKAREIQKETGALKSREIEQAVVATFLHSQPIGQKALTRELMLLLGPTRPDKIELEKALRRWAETSWFLDENTLADVDAGPEGRKALPKSWRLGSKPNLIQMHHDAQSRVSPDLVEAKMLDDIGKHKNLTAGASGAGARVHNMPDKPREIEDDGEFHFAVLGPKAACESGKPSPEARRFIDETTGPDRPRVSRNAVVLLAPSRDGLEVVRDRIRSYLAWEEVRGQLSAQELDPIRGQMLGTYINQSRAKIPEAIQQAYCIVVTVPEENEIQAFKIGFENEPLFALIKRDKRSRIQDTAVSADALLPGGPYALWKDGETARRVNDLVGAFAQFPHLPKMLRRKEIMDTLVLGAKEGHFVLRSTRPDKTVKTSWRLEPDEADLKDPSLEVVLPEAATLTSIAPDLLAHGVLPALWARAEISVRDVLAYFGGANAVKVKKDGYDEPVTIPKAERAAVEAAVHAAVKAGKLWLTNGPASILAEDIPAGILTDDAGLQSPPPPIAASDVLPATLPEAWKEGVSTAVAIAAGLSHKAGNQLPWTAVREALDGAFRARMLERSIDSGPWPCDTGGAANVKLRLPSKDTPPPPLPPTPGALVAEAQLEPYQIQDLAEVVPDLAKASAGLDLKITARFEVSGSPRPNAEAVKQINELLRRVSDELKLT